MRHSRVFCWSGHTFCIQLFRNGGKQLRACHCHIGTQGSARSVAMPAAAQPCSRCAHVDGTVGTQAEFAAIGRILAQHSRHMHAAQAAQLTVFQRTPIWVDVLRSIGDRPWLGYGYGSFWEIGEPLNPLKDRKSVV